VAADVYSLETQMGRGGWTWYTGSAGWLYRVWLEEILGFKLRGNQLTLEPSIPEHWPGYVITFRYRRTTYRIEVKNDGRLSKQQVRLRDDQQSHTIQFSAGRRPLHQVSRTQPPVVA
jgi:cellobiose phosphorylase